MGPGILSRIPIAGEDDVVFRDCHHDIYKDVGWLMYRAAQNPAVYQQLHDHPREALLAAHVPEDAIEGMVFNVVKDETRQDGTILVNIVVPEVKDENEFPPVKAFDRYLVELGVVAIRACKR